MSVAKSMIGGRLLSQKRTTNNMIDNVMFRERIGCFNQLFSSKSAFRNKNKFRYSYAYIMKTINFNLWKFMTILIVISTIWTFCGYFANVVKNVCMKVSKSESDIIFPNLMKILTGNFYARYIHGNIMSNPKGLNVYHINIRSIKNKMSEVKKIIAENKPHILGCSETEMKNTFQPNQLSDFKVPGYELLLPRSWELHAYARIVVYVKKSLSFTRLNELEDDNLQTVWIKCGFKNTKPGYFCQGYREHKSNIGASINDQQEKLDIFLQQWENAISHGNAAEPNDIFVLCDMNLDSLMDRWKKSDYHLYSLSQQVLSFCNANNLDQLVKTVTRVQFNSVTGRTHTSCIDHIYTNVSHKCSPPQVVSFGDSDHDLVGFTRLSKPPPEVARTIRLRSYKFFDKDQFLSDIAEIDWLEVLTCPDVELAAELFTNRFRSVLDMHAPWIVFQHRKFYKPWISQQTIQLMNERDELKRKAINLSNQNSSLVATEEQVEAWHKFKSLRNRINNSKKNEAYLYKKQVFEDCKSDSKQTWKSVKKFMDWKDSGSPKQIVVDNVVYKKAADVAMLLNEFFVSKINSLRSRFQNQPLNLVGCKKAMNRKRCSLSLSYVSVHKVEKYLKGIKPSKAIAVDGLDAFSLKLAAKLIAKPIHHIISLSLMQQRVPSLWKHSKIIPLHKKGDVLERKNYRPVSILPPISKVLERVIYEQLYTYFSSNKLFHQNVMGFRKDRSTLTATLQMYDRWVRGAGKGNISGVVLLDLSAAFDLVSRSILFKKLEVYGLDSDFINWIKCYLSERKQAVWVDHILSNWLDVDIGVPQGSILGPLLFIIFANDLPFILSCSLDQYADDSTLSCVKPSVAEINLELNANCQIVSEWMHANQLCLNADKTHLMLCGTSKKLINVNKEEIINVSMDGVQLTESGDCTEKILGVHLQSNLKWSKHCQELQAQLKTRLAGLCKLKNILNRQKRSVVAKSIF